MKISQILQIGTHHTNYCEDYLQSSEIGNGKIMMAVMDGCSMGDDSYFAATLFGKILRKSCKELRFKAFVLKEEKTLKQLQKELLKQLFFELKKMKNQLHLERDELLSTLILAVVDIENRQAEILTIGDGLVCCNDYFIEYEQDNQPDYLGYHLGEDFEEWYAEQSQFLSLSNLEDLSICTDGIFTFRNFDNENYPFLKEKELINFLLKSQEESNSEQLLKKHIFKIETEFGLKPTDDLAILRMIF